MRKKAAMEAEEGGVQTQQHAVQAQHIKKRALKNKALSVSFNEKDLSDFVTGFHKRKKKRRKEAQHLQQEAERRKRIELRKKRKLEREYVINGGAPPDTDMGPNENGEDNEQEAAEEEEEEMGALASISGTMTYDTGNVKVMVTTSEISRGDDTLNEKPKAMEVPKLTLTSESEKKHKVPVIKKQIKKVERRRSRPKIQSKREKRKGNKKDDKRR